MLLYASMRLALRCRSAPTLPSVMVSTVTIQSVACSAGGRPLPAFASPPQPAASTTSSRAVKPAIFGRNDRKPVTGAAAPS